MTPYHTGRVAIGSCWTPAPRAHLGHYELLVQRALLTPPRPAPLWRRIARRIYQWL